MISEQTIRAGYKFVREVDVLDFVDDDMGSLLCWVWGIYIKSSRTLRTDGVR